MIIDEGSEIWTRVAEAVAGAGLELIEVELAGRAGAQCLRVFVDKPGGVFISDCAAASRALGERLDEEDLIDASYRLEVSSPGLERPLRRARDFERYAGRRVRMRLKGKKGGNKGGRRRVSGKLLGADSGRIRLLLEDGESASFALTDIARANLEVDWDAEFGPGSEKMNEKIDR